MKIKTLLITAIGAFAIANVNAGDKAVVEVVEESADLGATLSVGYDSTYFFRGVDNGQNNIWTSIDYQVAGTPLAIGAWYGNPTTGSGIVNAGHSDELDLYANLSHSFGAVDAWVGYTAYLYPEGGGRTGGDSTNEVGAGIGGSVGPIDLALGVYYDFDIDGWYFDLTAGHTQEINDMISLQVAAGISYGIDYWTFGSDWNHIMLMAGLPIKLTDRATLTPYVAANFALDAIDQYQDDEIYGGISLSVDF